MAKKTRSRRDYDEGEWFAIPLDSGGVAVGLIARADRKGKVLLGYFFGPRRSEAPSIRELKDYERHQAALVTMFGDLGLHNGRWTVIGAETWDRNAWPLPLFARMDAVSGECYVVKYDEGDLCTEVSIRPGSSEECAVLPRDLLSGYKAVEIKLDRLLPQTR
jgi:hypothetical protein